MNSSENVFVLATDSENDTLLNMVIIMSLFDTSSLDNIESNRS